jgi:tetratricopeptide (TPR) repeat protein
MKAGEFEKSASVYRKGLDLAPDDTRLNLGLILVYLEAGNRQAAEDHIRKLEKEDKSLAGIINKFLLENHVENPQHSP